MPHVTIEFAKGLEQTYDMQKLCDQLFEVLAAKSAFDAADIKIRASRVDYYRIGTEPQSFVHATLLLMQGREESVRLDLNQTILDVLRSFLPDVGSITVQDVEMVRATYLKSLVGR